MLKDILKFRKKIVLIGVPVLVSRGVFVVWGFFTILIVRILPEDTYAAYSLARSIQVFAVMFGGSFMMQAFVKFVAEDNTDREKRIANAGIVLSLAAAIIVAGVLIVSGGLLQSFYSEIDLSGIPLALAVLVISSILSILPRNLLVARHMMKQIMYADIFSIMVRIGITCFFILTNSLRSPLQIFGAMIAGNIVAFGVNALFARDLIDFSLGCEKPHFRLLFGFSLVALGAGLADCIYTRTDILLLGKLSDESQVAGYSACRTLTVLMVELNTAAKIVTLPLISRMWSQHRRGEIVRRVMSTILIISIIQLPLIVLFACFPKEVLHLLFKGKYDFAWATLLILGLLAIVRAFGSQFATMAVGIGKPSFPLYALIASTIVNVILNFLLIPEYGALGAAIATVFAVVAGGALVTFLTIRYWRVHRETPAVSKAG